MDLLRYPLPSFFFIVIFNIALLVQGLVTNYTFDIANKRTVVYVNPDLTESRFLKVKEDNDTIYVVQVPISNDVTASKVICKYSFSTEVIIGPKGCDNPYDPHKAVEAHNCASDDQQAATNKAVLESSFWLQSGTSACIANGGDKFGCLGPIWLIKPNTNFPIDNRDVTPEKLIGAQGVCLITGFGPRCDGPLVTWLDIEMPYIQVSNTTCQDRFNVTFNGQFQPFYFDDIEAGRIDPLDNSVNDTTVFARIGQATRQRISLQRYSPDTTGLFRITLYAQDSAKKLHTSMNVVTNDWLQNATITLAFDSGCNATFTLFGTPAGGGFTLKQPQELNDLTFHKNQLPGHYYHSAVCNYRFGLLDEFNQLKHPFLKEGELGGGELSFKTPGLAGKPIHVLPDPNLADYEIDSCDTFYPPAVKFKSYEANVSDTDPYLAGTGMCNAPFLDADRIDNMEGKQDARYLDCYKQGGYLSGKSGTFCFRPIQTTRCKKGWIYYHQYCYYKFDADKESKFMTVNSLATDSVCQQLNPFAQTIKGMTRDVYLFLSNRFVFWKRQAGYPYRVNMGGRQCTAFDIRVNTSVVDMGYDDDTAYVYNTNCDNGPAFPVCRYHIKNVPIPYSEIGMSVNTIRTLRDGQSGVPHVGRELECKCYPGWSGRGCATATCIGPSLLGNTTLVNFFRKCYANSRGSCEDNNPRFCQCPEGYGPAASWTSEHHTHPCACPSVENTDPLGPILNGYIIDDVFYETSTLMVCGGSDRGKCTVEPTLNYGTCGCAQRTNMDPDAVVKREFAYDGTHCTAPVAMLPADQRLFNGDYIQGICAGRGTSCPDGQRYDEQRLDESYFSLLGRDVCRKRDGSLITGCVCDNGYSGAGCTCPVPKNILQPLLYPVYDTLKSNQAYANLITRGFVTKVVNVDDKTCNLTRVWIQDKPSSPIYECTPSSDKRLIWQCPSNVAVTKVYLETSDANVLFCTVKAYESDHPPCGDHPLPWAGAFFRNEEYRSYFKYELPQSSEFAPHGCTITECMCMAGYTGALCSYGVSAMRFDWDKESFHQDICGMITQPRRGEPLPNGKGCQCYNVQGLIPDARFTGPACEGVEVNQNGTWLPCANRGKIVNAKFPLGRCEFDLQDLGNDPLSTPFFGINPAVTDVKSFLYIVPLNVSAISINTTGTVFIIDGTAWLLPPLTTIYASPLYLPPNNATRMDFCDPRVIIPVNITYSCSGNNGDRRPQRVFVYVEYWSMKFICSTDDWRNTTCYETVKTRRLVPNTGVISNWCPTSWLTEIDYAAANDFDIDFECAHHTSGWEFDTRHEEEALESGFYADVVFWCGALTGSDTTTYTERSFATGVFDCSNPIDRVLADTAYALGVTRTRQCGTSSIPDHSDVNGAWYGLFEGFIPGLRFPHDKEWSANETQFIASLLGNEVCVPTSDDTIYVHEAFDGRVMDSISKTWIASIPAETTTDEGTLEGGDTDLPLIHYTNLSKWNEYRKIQWGNIWQHQSQIDRGKIDFPDNRPGYAVHVPLFEGQYVRKMDITIPFDGIEAMQVVGPDGVICYTLIHHALRMNDTVEVTCTYGPGGQLNGFIPSEPEWQTVLRLRDLTNVTLTNQRIANYYGQDPFQWITVLWSLREPANNTFKLKDFRIYSRNVAYTGLFESLKRSILIDNVFPPHAVYRQSCLRQPGRTMRAINVTRDIGYLRAVHVTHLAQRRCSDTSQCKKFARNATAYQCVFDMDYAQPWRGVSQADGVDTFIGDEGGCQCTVGMSDPTMHCSACVHGYGPVDDVGWARYKEMMSLMNITIPASVLADGEYCNVPSDPISLRGNKVCGGRGNIEVDQYKSNVTVRVFKATNETRRCLQLEWLDSETREVQQTFELMATDDDYDLKFIRYYDSIGDRYLTVLNGEEIYVDHTTRVIPTQVGLAPAELVFGDRVLHCVRVDDSSTHRMQLQQQTLVDSRQSFFLSKIQY